MNIATLQTYPPPVQLRAKQALVIGGIGRTTTEASGNEGAAVVVAGTRRGDRQRRVGLRTRAFRVIEQLPEEPGSDGGRKSFGERPENPDPGVTSARRSPLDLT